MEAYPALVAGLDALRMRLATVPGGPVEPAAVFVESRASSASSASAHAGRGGQAGEASQPIIRAAAGASGGLAGSGSRGPLPATLAWRVVALPPVQLAADDFPTYAVPGGLYSVTLHRRATVGEGDGEPPISDVAKIAQLLAAARTLTTEASVSGLSYDGRGGEDGDGGEGDPRHPGPYPVLGVVRVEASTMTAVLSFNVRGGDAAG